jgi:hypothetical protein
MKKNTLKYILISSAVLFPSFALAALDGLKGLIKQVGGILNSLIPVIFALCLIFFFWGLGQFILHAGDEKTRAEGRNKMIWGIIALFVFISIYGILTAISSLTGIQPSGFPGSGGLPPPIPGPF